MKRRVPSMRSKNRTTRLRSQHTRQKSQNQDRIANLNISKLPMVSEKEEEK
ncbi:MAG: hypothetical protein AAFR61_08120 [Bacteroidota bacterium]